MENAEVPTPSNLFNFQYESIRKKQYEIECDENIYSLLLEIKSNDIIYFKLRKANILSFHQYMNKYSYNEITKLLLLQKEYYNDLNKVFDFINLSIENKKIILKRNNNLMILKINKILDFEEVECSLELNENKIPKDEMIYILIDEVNEIKNKEKEKNKNYDIILELTKKNEEYKNRINNLENRIKKLEEEINNYKQYINKIIKEDVKKKDNNNIIINDGNQRENFKEIKDFSINQEVKLENEPQDDYELLIYIKDDQLLAYNSKYTFFKLKINLEYIKATFKSRYVNLGKSILLTGGIIREAGPSKKCYLISLIENDLPNKPFYDININPYGDFQEGRERHNLIYLLDKNLVFACGGIISKTCEYTNIYKGYWESVSPLNKSRANASMAYINGRYIYIIGGFELKFGERLGNYLNNLEYFDIRILKILINMI